MHISHKSLDPYFNFLYSLEVIFDLLYTVLGVQLMDNNFKLEGELVRLRPLEEKDIKNLIYYMTDDKEQQQWDAPWEN